MKSEIITVDLSFWVDGETVSEFFDKTLEEYPMLSVEEVAWAMFHYIATSEETHHGVSEYLDCFAETREDQYDG